MKSEFLSFDARLRFATALTLARLTGKQTPSDIADTLVALARKDYAHAWIAPAILSAHPDFLSQQLLPALATDDSLTTAEAFIGQLIYTRPGKDRLWFKARPVQPEHQFLATVLSPIWAMEHSRWGQRPELNATL